MAKKAVATLQTGKTDGRAYSKVIKMIKSPKTGAYIFDERMVLNEDVKKFFEKSFPKTSLFSTLLTSTTVILFRVKVPVLSEQITLACPSVSTAGKFRTTV